MKKLINILPFMEEEELKELALKIINGEIEGVKLMVVIPFLGEDDLDEIIDLLIEKKSGKELTNILPFASEEGLAKIRKAVQENEIEGISEIMFYPFLGKDQIKEMFYDLVKEAKNKKEEQKESGNRNHDEEDEEDEEDLEDEE